MPQCLAYALLLFLPIVLHLHFYFIITYQSVRVQCELQLTSVEEFMRRSIERRNDVCSAKYHLRVEKKTNIDNVYFVLFDYVAAKSKQGHGVQTYSNDITCPKTPTTSVSARKREK